MLSLFYSATLADSSSITIDGDEAHHAIKVMRMEIGELLQVTDGKGAWVEGSITKIEKKSFTIKVNERGHRDHRRPELVVIQALTKSDRAKEMIELLVEGGANQIIPWQSHNSVAKWREDMHEKWESAVIAACKQSRRYNFPQVERPISLNHIRERFSADSLILVFHESAAEPISVVLSASAIAFNQIVVVIGPEGGLSHDEIREFAGIGAKVVRLGNPVLRSAHAGIAALSAVQALIKRW